MQPTRHFSSMFLPQSRSLRRSLCLLLPAMLLVVLRSSAAATAIAVPMTPSHWLAGDSIRFETGENAPDSAPTGTPDGTPDGTPNGVLDIGKGAAELKDLVFGDGTIAFDIYLPAQGIMGLRLRAQDRSNAEALFFRPQADCGTAPDCLQYMPLEHGAYEWDLFPEYQAAAPIHPLAWNHIRIVAVGRTMQVYVNGASTPTLTVDRMEGAALSGALVFGGPAKYANLVVQPMPPVVAQAAPRPASDGFLRHWQVSPAAVLPSFIDKRLDAPTGVQPLHATMPAAGAGWKDITAQAKGLVNLSHELGSAKDPAVVSVALAKTRLISTRAQVKTVRIGFVREVWVYVNGVLVYTGRNLGDLPAAPGAGMRISLQNGTFRLPLKKGNNDIAIALDDNLPGNAQHFGWGMQVKLDDMAGIKAQQ